MAVNECEDYSCECQRRLKSRTSSEQFSYPNFVTYDGKAPMFSSCVDAIHLTLCVKVQK